MIHKLIGKAGSRSVWMDGNRLPTYNFLRDHSPDGFNWGYGGSGPAQLALAIMVEHYRQQGLSPKLAYEKIQSKYQTFKFDVISRLPQNEDFEAEIDLTLYL